MGKSAPSPPPAPNPYQVANAQTGSNIQTGIANTVLGNANESTPYGNVNYSQSGTFNVKVPQLDANGSPTGQFVDHEVPQWTRNVTLTPDQQTMLNQQNQLGIGLNDVAIGQTSRIGSLLGSPISADGLPARPTAAPNAPTLNGLSGGPTYANVNLGNAPNAPNLQNSINLQRASSAYDSVGGPQRGVFQRYTNTGFSDTGPIQGSVVTQNAAGSFGDAGGVTRSVGPQDFSADRQRYEDALYSRLNPQLQRDRDALETKLINQGLVRGTEAFNTSMDEYNRQANDARMQAVLAGGQEQQRMFGQQLARGQFENAAQSQVYDQALGRGAFANAAAAQNNAANIAAGDFANRAQGQTYDQALGRSQFAQNATGFNNAADLTQAQFGNAAQAQADDQAFRRGQFAQGAIAQNNQADVTEGNFRNAAAVQGFDSALNAQNFNNQAQSQQAQFNNQNLTNAYQDLVNQQRYTNDTAQRAFENAMNSANFQNSLRQQGLQEGLALRNQPINEISALMNGGQVNIPQFAQYNPSNIPTTPIGDYVYRSADIDSQNYQAQVAQQNAATGGMFGLLGAGLLGGMRLFSDRRLKNSIQETGIRLRNGLRVYLYRYAWEARSRVGLMADEVMRVRPQAVFHVGGFATVDYEVATQ